MASANLNMSLDEIIEQKKHKGGVRGAKKFAPRLRTEQQPGRGRFRGAPAMRGSRGARPYQRFQRPVNPRPTRGPAYAKSFEGPRMRRRSQKGEVSLGPILAARYTFDLINPK